MLHSGTSYSFVTKNKKQPTPMDPHSSVQPNSDGSVSINFVAQEVGSYEFNVLHNEVQLDGSPLRMYVGMVDKCFLSAYGPGLVHGRSGQKTFFRISRAPKLDDVTVDIEGPEKTEVMKKEDKKGMQVEYVPLTPGEYLINVKVKGNHINGSPFSAKISGLGTKKSVHQISTPGEYSLGVKCSEITGLIAYLKAPSALLEQVSLKKLTNGEIGLACFQPHKKGNYTVDLSHDGSKFKGSPFQINVGDKEVCNLDKVKVSGAVKDGLAGQWNNLVLNVAEAGYGELTVSLEGPFRTDIKSKQSAEKPKEFLVYYRPPEPGSYILGVKYGGEHITKSPFMVNVGGKSSGRVREAVQRNMTGTDVVQVGGTTEFCVTLPGCSPMDMEAELTSPSGSVELCEIRDQPGGKFLVKFTPSEKGLNIVSLKMKGIHVNGSPLPFTVGSSPIGGTHKVEFGGVGLERGVVGVKNEFNVYTREAGAGVLAVAMDGPSKAKLEIVDTHTGFAHVIYSVDKEGEYTIGLKYDGIHIPRSPITIQVDPDCKEAKKITIQALRDRGLEVFKAATFQVNLNGMQGSLAGFLTTPTGAKEEIVIEKLDVDQFMIRFTPQENGLYYVTVKFNDSHIPGSPLPMLVGRLGADPAQIKMEGKGIVTGKAGSLSKFYAITTNAGSGPLCILIEGPSRVAISCSDVEDGYEFSYTPTCPGEYLVTAKFCNVNVPGSPFLVKVGGLGKTSDSHETSSIQVETEEKKAGSSKKVLRGDANKVVVSGAGLKKGHISRIGNFNVEFKEAGFALMVVAMVSPRGIPVKELSCKKQKPGICTVSYLPEEKGDHCLHVRWGEDDVPGSPFVVSIV